MMSRKVLKITTQERKERKDKLLFDDMMVDMVRNKKISSNRY